METYKASLDSTSKIITAFVFLLAIEGIAMPFMQAPFSAGLLLTVIAVSIIAGTYMYSIKSYKITNEKLIIKRAFTKFDLEISLADIESVSIPNKEDFKWTIRTFGNGGLFGYYGQFANKIIGNYRMYGTNKTNRILIVLKDNKGKVVVSPDDAGMANELQKRLKIEA